MHRRLLVAAAIAHSPSLLLMDEPTAGLDPVQRAALGDLVREQGRSRAVVLATHLVEDVAAYCDEVIVLVRGEIAFHGAKSQLGNGSETSAVAALVEMLSVDTQAARD